MRSLVWAEIIVIGSLTATIARAEYPECLPGTPAAADVKTWRAAAIAALDGDDEAVAARIDQCFGATVPACLARTKSYALRNDIGSASNEPPYESTPERMAPKELLAPGQTGNKYIVPADIEAIAAAKGWTSVRYKSRHAGGFDSGTASLLMVFVPGDKVDPPVNFDRYLNFALPADVAPDELTPVPKQRVPTAEDFAAEASGGPSLPRTFTMVSLTRAAEGAPAKVYFQMFRRNFGGNAGVYDAAGPSGVTSCYSCHPNGMRLISPLGYHVRAGENQMPEAEWRAVKLINDAMDEGAGGKIVSWRDDGTKPLLRPTGKWPIYGPSKPINTITRTQAYIMGGTLPDGSTTPGCYKSRPTVSVVDIFGRPPGKNNKYTLSATPQIEWTKVKDAMRCEGCHNNRARGSINESTDRTQIDFKILVDQSMPLGLHVNPLDEGAADTPVQDSLTPDERIALANCLQAEIAVERPLLKTWLAQAECQ